MGTLRPRQERDGVAGGGGCMVVRASSIFCHHPPEMTSQGTGPQGRAQGQDLSFSGNPKRCHFSQVLYISREFPSPDPSPT